MKPLLYIDSVSISVLSHGTFHAGSRNFNIPAIALDVVKIIQRKLLLSYIHITLFGVALFGYYVSGSHRVTTLYLIWYSLAT